ncbi:phosphoribosylanthranilate isomerase [Dongia soli]|uniref:N-(5'-phosphoribosyl)anthranilate isomerase n=1 Tax=Dongia soli TaxID=600628 RepID=A0ABU5E844_9PROT|nr:phosphoribosylanthranilate isomerase [Dongia soli]MDY0882374.1 phosphoribosylanthranilate isomerase [Dongia soli]
MAFEAKICGLTTPAAVETAIGHGASHIGLVFFAKSPRNITAEAAGELSRLAAGKVIRTGLMVDASDEQIAAILAACPLDLLQLHGKETPERVAEIRQRFGLPVMKALQIGEAGDLAQARAYEKVADRLLFDAKPPASKTDALPGGNAVSFDWSLLAGQQFGIPWMLAGGLTADNLAEAVRASGARAADTSSGVEDRPGEKNLQKIKDFLRVAEGL